jgi:drug/metabolite transporter (DMT)-like permease
MTPTVVGLVLCAAILHASWNALLRSGTDRMWSLTVMSLTMTVLAIPAAFLLPLPPQASWPFIGLSSVLQLGYSLFLIQAYRHGDLGQVYPIARGCVPLLVTLGAGVFAGEHLGPISLTGIGLVSLGIMSLAFTKGSASRAAIGAALTTGVIVASYTVSDGIGVRLAGSPYAYSTWIFLIYGVEMPLVFLFVRRKAAFSVTWPETLKAAASGLTSLLTYVVVLWAILLSPIGPVSALRETSIVFAALIGRVFLREPLTPRRLGACIVIAAGAFCLSYRV